MSNPLTKQGKRGPTPRPREQRLTEARNRRAWDADATWRRAFRTSLDAGLKPCPSWPGVAADSRGGIWVIQRLPLARHDAGYLVFFLNYTVQFAHRAVCAAWNEVPPVEGLLVRHLDGDATNNHHTNLCWGTPQDNSDDRRRHGTDVGPSQNIGRRRAAKALLGFASTAAGPTTRIGDAHEFLQKLRAEPSPLRAVPDGQRLFAEANGALWHVWQPVTAPDEQGRPRFGLSAHQHGPRRTTNVRVQNLVADAHLGPRPPGMVLRHLDGDPTNNEPANLAYGTIAANMADRARHGRTPRGETHAAAKLSDAAVAMIRERYAKGERAPALAGEFNTTVGYVYHLVSGRWRASAVGPILPAPGKAKGEAHPGAIIDTAKAQAIHADLLEKKRLAETHAVSAIAERVMLAPSIVRRAMLNPSCIDRIEAPEGIRKKLRVELEARQAAGVDRYRDEEIAKRHGVGVPLVQNIARGAWSHVTGGKVELAHHLAPRRSSRTTADPATVATLFHLLRQQREAEERLARLTSKALAARFRLTKSQVDEVASGKRPWDSLRLSASDRTALRSAIAERAQLRAEAPTKQTIAWATGLSETFIKAVSAGHAWREEAVTHGYKPKS